jgi:hypothetical protein
MTAEGNGRPGHLTYYSDELPALFGGLDRYKQSEGGDRAFLLTCYTGGPHNVDRVMEVRSADDAYMNIVGGVQPGRVAKLFRGGEVDGLTARFGLAVEPKMMIETKWVDVRPDYDARDAVIEFIHGVWKRTAPSEGVPFELTLKLSGPAYFVASRWLEDTRKRAEAGAGTAFGAHLAKYPALFVRLCVVWHFIQHGHNAPAEVDEGVALAVKQLIDRYLEPHARRLYAIIDADRALPGAKKIAAWIRASGDEKHARIKQFNVRNIYRKGWSEFKHERDRKAAILEAIEQLDAAGWVRLIERKPLGAKAVTAIVNPKVFECR